MHVTNVTQTNLPTLCITLILVDSLNLLKIHLGYCEN